VYAFLRRVQMLMPSRRAASLTGWRVSFMLVPAWFIQHKWGKSTYGT
jgi:hypothetical protein